MLIELLEKRKNDPSSLTEDELKLLSEYDTNIKLYEDKINLLNTEKEQGNNLTKKTQDELAEMLAKYNASEETLKKLEQEKTELQKIIDDAPNVEELRIKIREAEEAKRKEILDAELKKKDEEIKEKEKLHNDAIEELRKSIKLQEERFHVMEFKAMVSQNIVSRPYLADKLNKLIADIDTVGLEKSQTIYNFLLDSVNHDIEMEKYKSQQSAGSNIFDKQNLQQKEKEDPFEAWLKKNKKLK